jgi:hypothetical protein
MKRLLTQFLAIPATLVSVSGGFSPALAAPKALKVVGRVSPHEATIHEAFALDQSGSKLAHIVFTGNGAVQMHVGAPGGKTKVTDLADFSGAPEKILPLAGHWFVVSNEGTRRAAIVDPAGRIKRQTGSFDDCGLVYSPPLFVTHSQARSPNGTRYTVQTYRPDGSKLAAGTLEVNAGGTINGTESATFLGFSKSYTQAMVQKQGEYNRGHDAREPPRFALYDVLTGKVGPGKLPPKLDSFLDYIHRRAEKPDLDAVIVLAAGEAGFELVGPGEKVRPLEGGAASREYDRLSLQQVQVGSRVVFSLVADRPGNRNMEEAGRYSQAFFALEPNSGKVTTLGEVPLSDKKPCPWSAGGNKIAVLQKKADGNQEIVIYAK